MRVSTAHFLPRKKRSGLSKSSAEKTLSSSLPSIFGTAIRSGISYIFSIIALYARFSTGVSRSK